MRFSIPDDDALTFSRTFYSYLVRGSSVEEAVYRVRLALARNQHRPWMVGMPVLYTALSAPAAGFPSIQGTPSIEEHQPRIEVTALPRAEGIFQGRADDFKALGDALTGDTRRRIVTIHGGGGQGKTALAREAVERFAYAWPGGVWATTLENLPTPRSLRERPRPLPGHHSRSCRRSLPARTAGALTPRPAPHPASSLTTQKPWSTRWRSSAMLQPSTSPNSSSNCPAQP